MTHPVRIDSAELVQEDHLALRQRIQHVQQTFHSPSAVPADLWREVRALEDEAAEHFLHEEDGGFFASLLESAPELGPQIAALERQHDRFRLAIGAIKDACRVAAFDLDQLAELAGTFDEFAHAFGEHEHTELQLVQEVVNRDLGAAG
jgi:hypothetical protein